MDEWDEEKRQSNLAKHGLDFVRFDWDDVEFAGEQVVEDERREVVVGLLDGTLVVAVYTERAEALRLISLRRATPAEQRRWNRDGRTRR